ncbi:MAG: hypothetical protein ACMUIP_09635 [bacterium]
MMREKNNSEYENHFLFPGMNIDCAVAINTQNESIDVRKALIYESFTDELIISQTEPPVPSYWIGKEMDVTYLNKQKNNIRCGVSCKINEVMKDYKLSSFEAVQAISLKDISGLKEYNFRFAYRVKPLKNYDISLFTIDNEELEIINISGLGVKFKMCESRDDYKLNRKIKLILQVKSKSYELSAKVIWEKALFIGAQFWDLDGVLADKLFKIIREIERTIAFNNKFHQYRT